MCSEPIDVVFHNLTIVHCLMIHSIAMLLQNQVYEKHVDLQSSIAFTSISKSKYLTFNPHHSYLLLLLIFPYSNIQPLNSIIQLQVFLYQIVSE